MVERKEYLQKLWSWKDEQVIKVVTGIRRCGKSTLLKQYQNKLKSAGLQKNKLYQLILKNQKMSHCWTTSHYINILKNDFAKTR